MAALPPTRDRSPALVVVVVVVLVAVVLTVAFVGLRPGVLLLAVVLALAGACRLLLPVATIGSMAVRSRGVDVATCWLLAVALAVLVQLVPVT